jgi:hypothetical protein
MVSGRALKIKKGTWFGRLIINTNYKLETFPVDQICGFIIYGL